MIKKIFLLILIACVAIFAMTYTSESKKPLSYAVLLVAQDQIKQSKPAPATAALEYAYVTLAYNSGLEIDGQPGAIYASTEMLLHIFPNSAAQIQSSIQKLQSEYNVGQISKNTELSNLVLSLKERFASDGHLAAWKGKAPTGEGFWYQTSDVPPFTPLAGQWKRWNVTKEIPVPKPPVVGSADDVEQIQIVKNAAQNRSGEDVQKINFWGGVPGTETPAGIWLNQLYRTVEGDLPKDQVQADIQFSRIQSILAQTLSDAFMECWKVKYTFWTARPDMRDSSIVTSMPNPNFPSYVSGHSTVSKAAADVLSVLLPTHKEAWQSMAREARDSRLNAGIHFEIDNSVGFDVGTEVAKQTIEALGL